MKPYIVSLSMGVLAGGIYGFFHTKSPAPPLIGLLGLLGMLIGEWLVNTIKPML
ncbi:XapX domain-containing protein [Sphaerotilus hippei]|uniref:XapX domain-containing protein n=1 Tax=Sphaerotilus hippei TaxID=744406 RepID=A0A318GYH5_9BURK|nr:DUF1427 family protein [Sphaerotilus hippei]PXW91970.1 XapX domain-containing protein [Sphaerotilus hippei]